MTRMLPPNDGVRGVDIEKPDGTKSTIDADKGGGITVADKNMAAKLKAEGFTFSEVSIGFANVAGHQCKSCAFISVVKYFTCSKCGEDNRG